MVRLARVEQLAAAERRRGREQRPPEAVVSALELRDRAVEHVQVVDVDVPRRGEVALRRVVRALLVLHARDELGDQEVVVRVALAVRVRRHVDGRARDPGGEVGAVVDVEAPHVVLVGLALAAVLADHDARDRLEHLARAVHGPLLDLLRGDDAHRARLRQAEEAVHGLVQVAQAAERAPSGHQHVGGERDAQGRLDGGRGVRGHLDRADRGRERGQPEVDLVASRGQPVDREASVRARHHLAGGRAAVDPDRHPRQGVLRLVDRAAVETAGAVRMGQRAHAQQGGGQEGAGDHGASSGTPKGVPGRACGVNCTTRAGAERMSPQSSNGLWTRRPPKRLKSRSAVHSVATPWTSHRAAMRASCTIGPARRPFSISSRSALQ